MIFWRKITSAKNAFRARLPSKLLGAAIPMRSAETELQNTRELRAMASEIVAPKPDLNARAKKRRFWSTYLKVCLKGKSLAPKMHFVRDFLQNSIGNSSTMQHHLQSHLHCGNDPTLANHNGILSTAHARKTLETPFTMRNRPDHGPRMIREWSDHTRDRLAPVAPQR